MWQIKETEFQTEQIVQNGNKFLIGNGYMGIRGTLDEFTKNELVAINLPGIYDQYEDKWRESVNAPNPLYTKIIYKNQELNPLVNAPYSHKVLLDIRYGIFSRKTIWQFEDVKITIESERFCHLERAHLIGMKYKITTNKQIDIEVKTGVDGDLWDINGPHLGKYLINDEKGIFTLSSKTLECQLPIAVSERIIQKNESKTVFDNKKILHHTLICLNPDEPYTFYKYASVYHTFEDSYAKSIQEIKEATITGFDKLIEEHKIAWDKRWNISDVVIRGDDEAQLALRYSIYHLLILAPKHSKVASIPARGLSGQTYKGAIFWDTEMFMLPFYLNTDLEAARTIINYRIHTLDGARRKAKEYGFRGAFYAWESQESGDDACTHFNVTDVFTNRPMRTYFRDKQIHISGDIAYAIYQTFLRTKDLTILLEGGAEVILECARFYYSYSYFKPDKNRYEILDVTGPDEYHERVNNNAFTNRLVLETFKILINIIDFLKNEKESFIDQLIKNLNFEEDLNNIKKVISDLYQPEMNEQGLIEQFDGYYKLEDTTVNEVKKRLKHPNEYWGGANGVATSTQVIKQADVVTMLYLFKNDYSIEVKKANWEYYEKRCEHGSSLSACMYALVACDIDIPNWAYPYFMKTASVDLNGQSKQYAGGIYIGGTHPAANGGAYMTAVYGFAGVSIINNEISVNPKLPDKWEGMAFKLIINHEIYQIEISKDQVKIRKE